MFLRKVADLPDDLRGQYISYKILPDLSGKDIRGCVFYQCSPKIDSDECIQIEPIEDVVAYNNSGIGCWADLEGADLEGAYLVGADLTRAYLSGANLRGANLRGAKLISANLEGTLLEGADLEGADLWWAALHWAQLEGANLKGANLKATDLREAHLDSVTDWEGAEYNDETQGLTEEQKAVMTYDP